MNSSLVAYVDESSVRVDDARQEYVMCAVVVDESAVESMENSLERLKLPGQHKLHWSSESTARRRKIVEHMTPLNAEIFVVSHRSEPNRKTERFRRKCLEQLYYELYVRGVRKIFLESRHKEQNRRDVEHLVALQGQGQLRGVRISHLQGSESAMVWIPDVVLGAYNSARQGDTRLWDPFEVAVVVARETPDSVR
ncbi:hypothetical protein [uncultured Corynebacterium sp.]|uniref:hypothetical protein n=1 Tax=uncultured Corynebacterium sp. TaxID=159447 RepID=UPI0025D1E88B|nr:hypothetical protein [uncultured Corynebacterium sp.]